MQELLQAILNFLKIQIFNNTLQDYLASTVYLVGLILFFTILKQFLLHRLDAWSKKSTNDFDDQFVDIISKIGAPVFIATSLYLSTLSLNLEETLRSIIRYAMVFVLTIQIILVLQRLSVYLVNKAYRRARPGDLGAETAICNITFVVRWGLWALGTIFILDNLGIDITTVVAGLGIGGIAVAMASQAILGDAFGALSIFVDKPFEVGDFIIVGDLLGTVEHVGLKTTRIRSLHGEQLVFSNSDLTSSRIRNFKRMYERRVAFKIGVTYQTTTAQVKKIPELVREIIAKIDGTRLDRVHFHSYGDFALIYEIVFYVLSPDYNIYMDKQQVVNIGLKEAFEHEGIEFAYPTQTLFVQQTLAAGKSS